MLTMLSLGIEKTVCGVVVAAADKEVGYTRTGLVVIVVKHASKTLVIHIASTPEAVLNMSR